MKILICGDRHWRDKKLIQNKLMEVLSEENDPLFRSTIIHGACSGADMLAHEIVHELIFSGYTSLTIIPYAADWTRYGKGAGPRRNQQMLDEGKPDIVLAFHNDIGRPNCGTFDMIKRANKAGVEVRLYSNRGA